MSAGREVNEPGKPDAVNADTTLPRLSKSRFMAGMQCLKRLYFQTHQPELAPPDDDAAEAAFAIGHEVGNLARKRHRRGLLISEELDSSDAESATRDALRNRAVPAIFEPAFEFESIRARADILVRTRDHRFDLIEVKSTLDPKPEHEWDLAIQYYVLRGAGVPIRRALLMHLNRDYVYPGGDYDLKRLFRLRNLSRLVRRRRPKVVAALMEMRGTLAADSPPSISTGPHCSTPYPCPFYGHCHQDEPEYSINQLPRLGIKLRERLATQGVIQIADIPEEFEGFSTLQARVIEAVRTGTRFSDPAISRKLEKLKFPIHFLDFETFSPALPLYVGTRPYQTIPFQWSDHVLAADREMVHHEFLHDDRSDPRRSFAEQLLRALGRKGSVVVYTSFETARLRELGQRFKDLAPALARVRERIVDLHPLIRDHVYDPGFHGSFSLKSVLPSLVPALGYDDLEITEGKLASLA